MNKKVLSIFIALVLVLSFSLVMATPVAAADNNGRGAVKLPLFEREPGYNANDSGTGDQAGWAIVNTNADGILIVGVHLDDSDEPNTTFSVFVKIDGTWLPADVVELTTNRQGKGNAHAQLNIADYTSATDTITVQVVVRVGPPTYLPGYASAHTSVPLKK